MVRGVVIKNHNILVFFFLSFPGSLPEYTYFVAFSIYFHYNQMIIIHFKDMDFFSFFVFT